MLRGIASANISGGSAITGTTITATTAFNVGSTDVVLTRYAAKQLMISGDGVGTASGMTGFVLGNESGTAFSRMWHSGQSVKDNSSSILAASTSVIAFGSKTHDVYWDGNSNFIFRMGSGSDTKMQLTSTAGAGPSITAGTTTSNANRALSISQGWTDGTSSNIGIVGNFDMGATGTATGKLLSLLGGAAGTTQVFSVSHVGGIISTAVAVSALNASPTVGEIQTVNDALAVTVKGATVAAGGSAVCQVMWDGSNWVGI